MHYQLILINTGLLVASVNLLTSLGFVKSQFVMFLPLDEANACRLVIVIVRWVGGWADRCENEFTKITPKLLLLRGS